MVSRPAWLTPRAAGVGSTVTAVVVALLVWWLQGEGGTTPTADEPTTSPSSYSASAEPTPGATASSSQSAGTPAPTAPTASAPLETLTVSGSDEFVVPGDDPTDAMPATDPDSGLPYVALADLPPEAAETVDLIDAGGPFPYDKDGSTFGNYEGLLPDHESGYYEEYTVETPGSPDRGARRIVAGAAGELYWTADHYESFERIWR